MSAVAKVLIWSNRRTMTVRGNEGGYILSEANESCKGKIRI